jgi:hypothetical protein
MSIIPASALSPCELARLGNNLRPCRGVNGTAPGIRRSHAVLAAVNRSLAAVGEQVGRLHRPAPAVAKTFVSGGRRAR